MENFVVLEEIGSGAFGQVHKVQRTSDGQIMARKCINYRQMSDKEKQQLVMEVNIIRELRHQNVVRYYERIIDKDSQHIYIFMEYCGGGDLSKIIKKTRTEKKYLDESIIWRIFTHIVSGLHECHFNSKGVIIHRDIKPENIFLDEEFNAKIGDFGLSRPLHKGREFARSFVGTPYYMSPEQICDSEYDSKSDIWSLGCVLYELCALSPPFEASTHLELAKKIKAGKVNKIPQHYGENLTRAIRSMLQTNPQNRPQTSDLLQIPQVKLFIKERVVFQQLAFLRDKEAELAERERRLLERERELRQLEQEIEIAAREQNSLIDGVIRAPLQRLSINKF